MVGLAIVAGRRDDEQVADPFAVRSESINDYKQ